MASLVLILIAVLLLGGFIALTNYEERRGTRVCAVWRTQFDADIERAQFVLTHADIPAFLQEETSRFLNHAGHMSAHVSLQGVRAAERRLTRLVRHFRSKDEPSTALPPRENAREFVQKLSDFKGGLQATRPEFPDIHNDILPE